MSNKILGQIKVAEVVDNPDGTCTIRFDISDEMQQQIIESMGWSEWSEEKFNQFVIDSLDYYASLVEKEKGQKAKE